MNLRRTMSEGDDRASEQGSASVDVDLTLIDEMLRMTPTERLRQNDRMATLAARLRESFEACGTSWPSRES